MKAKMVEVQELLSDDLELLLREIDEYCAASNRGIEVPIPNSIENYLLYVARTGNTIFPWQNVRPLFRLKLKSAIGQFQGEPSSIEPSVFERFDIFRSAPFTIQRLSELITAPCQHYKIKDKFVCALEKTVFVVSTIEPKPTQDDNIRNGSEENNSSSSEEGLIHENNSINFENIHHNNDYNYNNTDAIIGSEFPTSNLSLVVAAHHPVNIGDELRKEDTKMHEDMAGEVLAATRADEAVVTMGDCTIGTNAPPENNDCNYNNNTDVIIGSEFPTSNLSTVVAANQPVNIVDELSKEDTKMHEDIVPGEVQATTSPVEAVTMDDCTIGTNTAPENNDSNYNTDAIIASEFPTSNLSTVVAAHLPDIIGDELRKDDTKMCGDMSGEVLTAPSTDEAVATIDDSFTETNAPPDAINNSSASGDNCDATIVPPSHQITPLDPTAFE